MCRLFFWSDQDFLNHRGFSGEPTRDEGLDGIAVGVANRPVTPPQWRLNWNPDKTWTDLKIYPGSHRKIESVHTELELDPWRIFHNHTDTHHISLDILFIFLGIRALGWDYCIFLWLHCCAICEWINFTCSNFTYSFHSQCYPFKLNQLFRA